jgi:hypothetical protein
MPQTLHEPEAWTEWLRAGIRFSRPAVAFYGGRPSFSIGRGNTELPQRVRTLAQQLNIGEHQVCVCCVTDEHIVPLFRLYQV